jgi:protein SCO1/2
MLKQVRVLTWALVALAAVGLGFLLFRPAGQPPQSPGAGMVSFGGPFTLTGANGQPFSSSRIAGRPYAIFFGFTHCPDVCPTTLARLVRLRNQLEKKADAFEIIFVSVDPERDGPKEVGAYTQLFGSPIIGLTGSPAQIERVKKQYGIFSEKVDDGAGGYNVDHTATVLLFGKDGKLAGTISHDEQDGAALAKLERISI